MKILLVHGGPGLYGYMDDLNAELARNHSCTTYSQKSLTVDAHVEELKMILENQAEKPVLVGHSWGGLLSMLTLAKYPALARKIVLVGPMPFDMEGIGLFVKNIESRLTTEERVQRKNNLENFAKLDDSDEKNSTFKRLSDASFKTYQYHPALDRISSKLKSVDSDVFFATQADLLQTMAKSSLLDRMTAVKIPVEMIYGDYDPSPCARLAQQLKEKLNSFSVLELKNCGHYPWWEDDGVHARFISALEKSFN